jgi:cytochrome c peroxidase
MSLAPQLIALCLLVLIAAQGMPTHEWTLPEGFPEPPVPADNPLTVAKVELGRHLFYEAQLSGNAQQSCASCHRQELAFSDGLRVAVGSTGERHSRNSQGLANVAYAATLTWASPSLTSLEHQVLIPMFGEKPVELGLSGREAELVARLRARPLYRDLFAAAYPEDADPFTLARITQALASFVRTIVSYRSPYDRYVYEHDERALGPAERRGMELFFSERLECFHCHNGFNFSDATVHADSVVEATSFHDTGLPAGDQGLAALTHRPEDVGRFRAPSLRNVELTAPYMHDGSIATLEHVVAHYESGGADSPRKSPFVRGFVLSDAERRDLIAFLKSLTDRELTHDSRLADPFVRTR